MADFLIGLGKTSYNIINQKCLYFDLSTDLKGRLVIIGSNQTYFVEHNGNDFIVSLGYLKDLKEESISNSLKGLLKNFAENRITEFKQNLIGQFVLLVKKANELFLFTDFLGARNIFYSVDKRYISTSFNLIEDVIGANADDLDFDKFLEFIAVRTFYPSWIGRDSINKRIKWLMPYEYIKINLSDNSLSIKKIQFCMNNKKSKDYEKLAKKLKEILEEAIMIREFSDSIVASSITGGIDSRLIGLIVSKTYKNTRLRISYSEDKYDSLYDLKIAKKLSEIAGLPLDVYKFNHAVHLSKYYQLTEGMSPIFNKTITPILEGASIYKIGFGGSYASELFEPLPYSSSFNFIAERLMRSKRFIDSREYFWGNLYDSFKNQMEEIKKYYVIEEDNEIDYLRIFYLNHTSRYSSFLVRGFNQHGLQIEPYGSFRLLELALQLDQKLFGNSKWSIEGEKKIQKTAIRLINESIAKQIAFKEFRPSVPFSMKSLNLYLNGFFEKSLYSIRSRITRMNISKKKVILPNATYISDGFDYNLIKKVNERYGVRIEIRNI